jgi:FlaG/FlaF family flagellin (archaellin)
MKHYKENAVSPVVGVMLMLVVTIIIAAVVSGFAGGLVKGQTKAPQATIQGTFSVTSGLTITNAGGDAIPTSSILITTTDGPTFGPGLSSYTTNPVPLNVTTNSAGTPIAFYNPTTNAIDGYNVTSFNPGDTWYVNITNCYPVTFQPSVYSSHGTYYAPGSGTSFASGNGQSTWTFSSPTDAFWGLDFVNQNNIGKQFYLDIYDKATGAVIGQTTVTITG